MGNREDRWVIPFVCIMAIALLVSVFVGGGWGVIILTAVSAVATVALLADDLFEKRRK